MEFERNKIMVQFKTLPEGEGPDDMPPLEEGEEPPLFIDYM